jgi:uncharacterized protein
MLGLVDARVFHARLRPKKNSFRYRALYLLVDAETLSLPSRHGLFAIDKSSLFSLRTADYGDGTVPPARWIRDVLDRWDMTEADGAVRLMTMPRIFGYAFNPVNFWLCFDRSEGLRAVLAEVSNTFGERHSYLCAHEDHRVMATNDELKARKVFHVSPFLQVRGEYSFRFTAAAGRIAVAIAHSDEDGLLLNTSVGGLVAPLTSWRLLAALLTNPLYPLKVIGLIHYQALRLFLKGVRNFRKPEPPTATISR